MKQIKLMGFDEPVQASQKQAKSQKQGQGQQHRDLNRKSNVTRHRKRRKKNYILYYIFITILMTILLVTLSLTVLFNIDSFIVLPEKILNPDKIIEASGIKKGDNLFRINISKAEQGILANNITLDSVEINRKFPATLEIKANVAKPMLAIEYDNKYYYISKNQRLIGISDTNDREGVMIVSGLEIKDIKLGEYINAEIVSEYDTCMTLIESINEEKLANISYINISDLANIKLYYKDKIEIKLGSISDLSYKLERAKKIIDSELENGETGTLDVQINAKAFFKQSDIILPEVLEK